MSFEHLAQVLTSPPVATFMVTVLPFLIGLIVMILLLGEPRRNIITLVGVTKENAHGIVHYYDAKARMKARPFRFISDEVHETISYADTERLRKEFNRLGINPRSARIFDTRYRDFAFSILFDRSG